MPAPRSELEGGFDIVGGENSLPIAALQPTGAAQSTLYRVNLGTGTLTSLGLLGSRRHDHRQGARDSSSVKMRWWGGGRRAAAPTNYHTGRP